MMNAYDRTFQLRCKRGLIGYAVYCRLVELCASAPLGRLKYDSEAVAWDLRDSTVDAAFVDSVVSDYGLFIKADGGFIEDIFNPSSAYVQARIEEERKAARSAAAKKGAATRAAKAKEARLALIETPSDEGNSGAQTVEVAKPIEREVKKNETRINSEPNEYYRYRQAENPAVAYDANKLEQVRAAWNKVYKGVRGAEQRWFAPPQTLVETFREVSDNYSVKDFEDAFGMARKDPKITWRFETAVRQVGFLLSKIETEKNALEQKQREQDERDGIDRSSQSYKENLAALERMWQEGTVDPENPTKLLKDRIKTPQQQIEEELGW